MGFWKRRFLCAVALGLAVVFPCAADADLHQSYTYTYWGDAVT